MAEYLSRNVKKETEEHYRHRWPFAADARRNLYLKYARKLPADIAIDRGLVLPGAEDNPYDIDPRDSWGEIADEIIGKLGDNTSDKIGMDGGASSGYFIRKMLEKGYRGRLIGVDIEMETQAGVEEIVKNEFPEADLVLGGSDIQSLRELKFYMGDELLAEQIPDNYFDFVTALYVLYHVPDYEAAYEALHRVAKPDATAIFSGRSLMNQDHLWRLGRIVANHFGLNNNRPEPQKVPRSFYDHHGVEDMETYLKASPLYELEKVVHQGEHLWIPNTQEGWEDYKWALMTLPYGKHPKTGRFIKGQIMSDYLDDEVRKLFNSQAQDNGTDGKYFIDYVFQAYMTCRVIK